MNRRLKQLAAGSVMILTMSSLAVVTSGSAAAAGTGYWVDNTAANCSDTLATAGTQTVPFCTVTQGTKKAIAPGDIVHVAPGTYREQVTVNASGTATDPITVTGDGPGVVILGTRALGTAALWTATSTTAWSTPYAPPSPPRQVFLDGQRLSAAASATTTTPNSWFYDATAKVLYVDAGGANPGDGHQIEAGAQSFGITASSRQNLVISNLEVIRPNFAGVRLLSSSATTIDHVTASQSASNGILIDTSPGGGIAVRAAAVDGSLSTGIRIAGSSGVVVTGSSSHHNGLHGIGLSTSSNNVIDGNATYANTSPSPTATSAGIDVNTNSPDNTVSNNVTYQNQDTGVQIYNGSHRALVVRNISYANGDHGFDTLASTGARYLNNTSYANRRDGISVEGVSTGATLANNLTVDNGVTANEYNLYVDAGSLPGFGADYDTAFNHTTAATTKVGGTVYQKLSAYAAASGQESHGSSVDPDLVDPASGDFRLTAGSTAVDSANSATTGFHPTDPAGNPLADDPIVADTGAGSPAYADRGALEFQPVAGATNYAPHAALVVDPAAVSTPPSVPVTADASGSSDADQLGIATYTFDFGDGTVVGPQAAPTAAHSYAEPGSYAVAVTVTDGAGLTDSASAQEVVSTRPVQTYSVEQTNPACTDAGPGTAAAPFCTIGAATTKLLAGDTALVGPGQYREQVTITRSGEPANPITLKATSPSAVIVGTNDVSDAAGWTATATTAWKHTFAVAPTQVFLDGQALPKATSATTTTTNNWFYDAATTSLYVDTGGTNPAAGHAVAAGARSFGVLLRQVSDIAVSGFAIRQHNFNGVALDRTQRITLGDLDVAQAGAPGVTVDASSNATLTGIQSAFNLSIGVRFFNSTDSELRASVTHENQHHGVSVQGSTRVTVAGVITYLNKRLATRIATGIDVSAASQQTLIEANLSYGNDDSGVEAYSGSTDTTIRRNVVYDNGDHGIDTSFAPTTTVLSNTVVRNATAGINFEGGSTNSTSRDNVAMDNAVGSTRTIGEIRVDEASIPGATLNRDLVFQTAAGGALFEWASQDYSTIAAFRTASGQEAAGQAANPNFVNLTGRDLHLTSQSPAIDAADTGVTGWTATNRDGTAPTDHPTVANTGVGPIPFADLGALEYAGPVARAIVSPATGFAPLDVTVNGSTSVALGTPITAYRIVCGNATVLTSASGTCQYAAAGTFTPTVTVTDESGLSDTWTSAPIVVKPNGAPTAKLTATPNQAYRPQQVVLNAGNSSDADGRPLASYTFDCGNGQTTGPLAASSFTCSYQDAGTFTARVTVRDTDGLTSTATAQVKILADVPPTAKLMLSKSSIKRTQTITADASGSTSVDKSPIATYLFNCGNGPAKPSQTAPTALCTYTSIGTFTVNVTVTDTVGLAASATKTVKVLP
ncbi:PKD domain-containing protein [Kribbella qitaiheensis]|uniref:PKD domain-containing protein n=1 Tax=Kribbella qitaiheensis TaxID=1544730 RepID=UPI003621F0F0